MDLADPQQRNAYVYANNNPVTWSDPTGLLLGPLIDGAYAAPTAGKPGSGGWQVGPNNTGYTGSWNNGGAGKWSRPGTRYEPPVTIRRDPAADQARAQAAAAAKAKAQARAAAEQRAREQAAAEAERKKQAGIGQQVGNWLNDRWSDGRDAVEGWLGTEIGKNTLKWAGRIGAVAGIAGGIACIVATGGACAVLGVIALGGSGFVNGAQWLGRRKSGVDAVSDFTFDFALGRVPAGRFIKGPRLNPAAWDAAFDTPLRTTAMVTGNLSTSLIAGYNLGGIGPTGSGIVGWTRERFGS